MTEWWRQRPEVPLLRLITPVSRPDFIPKIEPTVRTLDPYFNVEWLVITDDEGEDLGGGRKRNKGLDACDDEGWVAFLDDDTVVHPEYGRAASTAIKDNPDAQVIIFRYQLDRDGRVRLDVPELWVVRPDCIDTQQVLFRAEVGRKIRWRENLYNSDGFYIREVVRSVEKDRIVFSEEKCVIYNALRGPCFLHNVRS